MSNEQQAALIVGASNDCNDDDHDEILENLNDGISKEELERIKSEWIIEQEKLKEKLIIHDDDTNELDSGDLESTIRFIGGVDISFDKKDPRDAIASLIILSYPNLKVVYEKYEKVRMAHPYIPGFLAFREVPHLKVMIEELLNNSPQFKPQIILVDGNGILHQRGFGLASHLGVVVDIPTVGVAKKLLYVDGLTREGVKELVSEKLKKKGDYAELVGETTGKVFGVVLQPTDKSIRPLYISIGHKVCLDTAIKVVQKTCIYKIPEPIRQADLRSRSMVDLEAKSKKK